MFFLQNFLTFFLVEKLMDPGAGLFDGEVAFLRDFVLDFHR